METNEVRNWQTKMLPLMVRMVVGLTLFFFLATLVQLVYLHVNIKDSPELLPISIDDLSAEKRQLHILEVYVINKRHHQANVLLMSRVWTRYLGFTTGMILAMVGAIFVLGKLQSPASDVQAEAANVKMSVKSASPGIVLAALGVMLMSITIVTHHEISISDRPLYTSGSAGAGLAPMTDLEGPATGETDSLKTE